MTVEIRTGPGNQPCRPGQRGEWYSCGLSGTVARMFPGFDSRALQFGHGGCWIVSNNHFIGHAAIELSSMADFIL
jgi:hypothetical protein